MWNILLVDDEKNEREGMKFLIKRDGLPLRVYEAANGRQALEIIQEKEMDILLTDVKMPYMDGLELALRTRKIRPKMQIIIFSAYSEFDYAKRALEAQVVNYLLKPIELEEFSQVMGKVIDSCERRKQEEEREKKLKESDRKMLLLNLLLGKKDSRAIERLREEQMVRPGEKLFLMAAETKERFFDKKEELFLKILKENAPCSYEYLNLYPNESRILFHSQEKQSRSGIEAMCREMNRSLSRVTGQKCSFFISRAMEQVQQLEEEIDLLNRIKRESFEYQTTLVWAEEYVARELRIEDVEIIRFQVKEAIENHRLQETKGQIGNLIHAVAAAKAVSVIYIHHIFYDTISSLYGSFGIYDPEKIYERINQTAACTDEEGLRASFQAIFEELEQLGEGQEKEESLSVTEQIRKIVQKEYYNDLSLDYMAEKVGLTASYLSYMFKKETGDNLVKYVTDVRMEKAKRLLAETNMKIFQVAERCGYDNTSYFNRLFKNYFGVSPKQYKEKAE